MSLGDVRSIEAAVGSRLRLLRGLLVAGCVLLIPLVSHNVTRDKVIAPVLVTVAMGLLLLLSIPTMLSWMQGDRRNPAVWLALLFPALMTVASLFNSGPETRSPVLMTFVAAAIAITVWDMTREEARWQVVYPLLIGVSVHSVLAVAQLLSRQALVPDWIATGVAPRGIDGVLRVQGTTSHVYVLAAFALLAIGSWVAVREAHERLPLAVGVALGFSTVLVGITFSRAAMLGLAIVVFFLIVAGARGDRSALTLATLLATVGIVTVLLTSSGWSARVEHSTASSIDEVALGRVTLVSQSVALIRSAPVVGVGPGQYLRTLEDRGMIDERYPFIVHNLPLAFTAENGVLAGLVVAGLLLWVAIASLFEGAGPSAVYFGTLSLMIFDVMHYSNPSGRLMMGVWLGVLAAALRWGSERLPESEQQRGLQSVGGAPASPSGMSDAGSADRG